MKKILSISIAAYNVEEYLEECVNSIIESNVIDKIEIIIVNDGSKDNTIEIAHKYLKKYPNSVKVVDKKKWRMGVYIK